MSYHQTPPGKDPQLWEMARKRADFKRHFVIYLIVNVFFWALWFLGDDRDHRGLPWPVFPGVGWGIGIVFHYLGAYQWPQENSVEKEYEKLINSKK